MIALDSPELVQLAARLAPYARQLLDRCAHDALQLHAEEVGPEHLLSTLMSDEECAAHRAALHAFADPATIRDEALTLAAGILISGSSAALPFSAFGVRALRGARERAAARGDAMVEVPHLALAAFDELEADLRELFAGAGWSPAGLEALLGSGGAGGVVASGHLFRHFSDDAKRALSAAARLARASSSRSISAAHLFQASLQAETRIERACGMPAARARIALRGRLDDMSAVSGSPLAPDDALAGFLARLPGAADSLEMLRALHAGGTPELAQVLVRHKVTAALLERARAAFEDPR